MLNLLNLIGPKYSRDLLIPSFVLYTIEDEPAVIGITAIILSDT